MSWHNVQQMLGRYARTRKWGTWERLRPCSGMRPGLPFVTAGPPISSTSSESVAHQRLNEPNPLLDTYPYSYFRCRPHWILQSHPVSFGFLDPMRLVLLWILPFAVELHPVFPHSLWRSAGPPVQSLHRSLSRPLVALLLLSSVARLFLVAFPVLRCESLVIGPIDYAKFSKSVRRSTVQPHADTPRRWIRRVRDEGRISGDSADFEPLYVSRPRL